MATTLRMCGEGGGGGGEGVVSASCGLAVCCDVRKHNYVCITSGLVRTSVEHRESVLHIRCENALLM